MKNLLTIVLGIAVAISLSTHFSREKTVASCGQNEDMIVSYFQEWLTNGIAEKDKRIKNNPIKVVDVDGAMEYNEIPEVMKHPLYENLKDSRVCKATLFVNYTPDKEKENIEEINIRFQKVLTSPDDENNRSLYVSVSGLDVENMVGEGIKLFQKYHKK